MKSKRRLTANPLFGEFERALYQIKQHPWQGQLPQRDVGIRAILQTAGGPWELRAGRALDPSRRFLRRSLSTNPALADSEAARRADYYQLESEKLRPRVRVAVWAKLASVLNLTRPSRILTKIAPVQEWLHEDWRKLNDVGKESISQALARSAHAARVEAILVPSAVQPDESNLIVFVGNLRKTSELRIENQSELDRWVKVR